MDYFDDPEDDKSNVRSAIDALADTLTSKGKRRCRPRKNPVSRSSSRSSSLSSSRSESDEECENRRKKRKRVSDDEEWDEGQETLTLAERRQMRTRKRPLLYAEESVAREAKRRQPVVTHGKGDAGSRGCAKICSGPSRACAATYNKQVQPSLFREAPPRPSTRPTTGFTSVVSRGGHQPTVDGQTPVQRVQHSHQQQKHRVSLPNTVPGTPLLHAAVPSQSNGAGLTMVTFSGGAVAAQKRTRKLVELSHRDGAAEVFKCLLCTNNVVFERELMKAHLTRAHLHMCGHCTSAFVDEQQAKNHSRKCRSERDHRVAHPDPRQPHLKTRCPLCSVHLTMVEMTMHLLDAHLTQLEYHKDNGRMNWAIEMVGPKNEAEVERLRYKYYLPPDELAKSHGYQMCHVCGLQFPDQAKLQIHLKLHPEFMYFCWVCPRVTSASMGQVGAILRHLKHIHLNASDTRFLECPLCRVNMASRPMQHLLYECEHNFICQLCRDLPSFANSIELKNHREKCHYNALRRFECSHCAQYFSTTQDFAVHLCDQNAMKTACSCGMEFRTRKLFNVHFEMNHGRGGICTLCDVKFQTGDDLAKHMFNHGQPVHPRDARHLLICAYGELKVEAKALYTAVSNASFRLSRMQGGIKGGSEECPVELSDDDDDIVIVEQPSTAARLTQPKPAVNAGDPAVTEKSHVTRLMEEMLDRVVAFEDNRLRVERREAEARLRSCEAPLFDLETDSDDDCVMVEDGTSKTTPSEGGQNQLACTEEERETNASPNQPAIREFTPDGDDDLCVVAEVENPGCATAAATISKQRQKTLSCDKCSSKFITKATLADHMQTAHRFDAGATTLLEEVGIPVKSLLWICKSCCLAFETADQQRIHCSQHGQRPIGCNHCSGCAYNNQVMRQHARRIVEKKLAYICGECKTAFDHETCLQEHNSAMHGVTLLYFCKRCEMGSTDGAEIYRHFLAGCTRETKPVPRTHEEAVKSIGVVPARQLHYQPVNIAVYKQALAQQPDKFIIPSVCNHRSMIAAMDKQVTCNECKCLENIQRHVACLPSDAGRAFESQVRSVRAPPPLHNLRFVYDHWVKQLNMTVEKLLLENKAQPGRNSSRVRPQYRPETRSTVPIGGYEIIRVGPPRPSLNLPAFDPQEAQRRHDEKFAAVAAARLRMEPAESGGG